MWLQLPLQRAGFHIRRTGWYRWTASKPIQRQEDSALLLFPAAPAPSMGSARRLAGGRRLRQPRCCLRPHRGKSRPLVQLPQLRLRAQDGRNCSGCPRATRSPGGNVSEGHRVGYGGLRALPSQRGKLPERLENHASTQGETRKTSTSRLRTLCLLDPQPTFLLPLTAVRPDLLLSRFANQSRPSPKRPKKKRERPAAGSL